MQATWPSRVLFLSAKTARLVLAIAALWLAVIDVRSASATNGTVKTGGQRFENSSKVLSPPILQRPIYACADTVVVKGFVPGAKIEIFVAGNPVPIGGGTGIPYFNETFKVATPFVSGQVVTAVQIVDGVTSAPSNAVTVRSHKEDFPTGLPQPRLDPVPCYECGRAVGIADVIPGAWWKVFAEDSLPGGAFASPVEVGGNKDFPYTFVTPAFKKGQRITALSGICDDKSDKSLPQIVQAEPATIPPPILDPVYEGADRVVV